MKRGSGNKILIVIFIFLTGFYFCEHIDDEDDLLIIKNGLGERLMNLETFVDNKKIKRSAKMKTSKRNRKKKKGKGKGKKGNKGKNPKAKGFSCKKKKLAPKCINKKFTNKIKAVEKNLRGFKFTERFINKICESGNFIQTAIIKT